MNRKMTALVLAAASTASILASFQSFAADKYDNEQNRLMLSRYKTELTDGHWIAEAEGNWSLCADPKDYSDQKMCLVDLNNDGVFELITTGHCEAHGEYSSGIFTSGNIDYPRLYQDEVVETISNYDPSNGFFIMHNFPDNGVEGVYQLKADGKIESCFIYHEPSATYIQKERYNQIKKAECAPVFVDITPENIEKHLSGNGTPTAASLEELN